jgi:hypothetical protein
VATNIKTNTKSPAKNIRSFKVEPGRESGRIVFKIAEVGRKLLPATSITTRLYKDTGYRHWVPEAPAKSSRSIMEETAY